MTALSMILNVVLMLIQIILMKLKLNIYLLSIHQIVRQRFDLYAILNFAFIFINILSQKSYLNI